MGISARQIRELVDWPLILGVMLLVGAGFVGLESATGEHAAARVRGLSSVQLIWAGGMILAIVGTMALPTRFWYGMSYVLYAVGLALLALTLLIGQRGMGAERWLVFGPVRIQASEISKVLVIVAMSRYLSGHRVSMSSVKHLFGVGSLVLAPAVLIWMQPDLGTMMVYFAITLPMVYWAGLKNWHLFAIVSPFVNAAAAFGGWLPWLAFCLLFVGLLFLIRPRMVWVVVLVLVNLGVGIITPTIWDSLKPHQQRRIETFFSPEKDPLGAGYQIIQSKVAIGSGGTYGKGFKQGSQTRLAFLPETHTDFIFAVIGEEWGFAGTISVLLVLFLVVWRVLRMSIYSSDSFSKFICIGIGSMLAFHIVVNIGMTVGLMPVTGLPLPFVSYGGSSLITNGFAIGLVLGAGLRRFE